MVASSPVIVFFLAYFLPNLIFSKNLIKKGAQIKETKTAKAERTKILITLKVKRLKTGILTL